MATRPASEEDSGPERFCFLHRLSVSGKGEGTVVEYTADTEAPADRGLSAITRLIAVGRPHRIPPYPSIIEDQQTLCEPGPSSGTPLLQ